MKNQARIFFRFGVILLVLILVCLSNVMAGGEAEKKAAAEEKVKLEFLFSTNVDTEGFDINDNPYLSYIEQQNDVDITLINAAANLLEKLNTVLASGDLPDYMQVPGTNRDQLSIMANEGFILSLDDRIPKWLNLSTGFKEISWDMARVNGKIYGVPHQRFDPTPLLLFVKTDWVNKLGIDTTKVKTVDDWYKMLKAFTDKDPDGDGKKNTFGFFTHNWAPAQEVFLDAFDGHLTRYVDGEVRPYYISDGYKQWLKWMAKLVKEGIMDPEFMTVDNQKLHENSRSGKRGAWCFFWHITEWISAGLPRDAWTVIAPPLKPDGTTSKLYYPGPNRHYIVISTQSEHPEKVMQIMDWALSNEGGNFIQAGVEGRDYDIVNGEIKIKPERAGKSWAWRVHMLGIQKSKLDDHMKKLLPQVWGEAGTKWLGFSNEYGRYDDLYILAPAKPELADYDLDGQMMEFRAQAILGQIDIDAEWDKWVAKWRKSGGNEWIKHYTEWYLKEYKK
jgi:putative aldouronate transport system substrate-binding protein